MSDLKALTEKVNSLTKKVTDFFSKQEMKFAEVTTTDGKVLSYDGELAEGTAVMIDGAAAADGAYTLEDGTVCNVKDGVIQSITKPEMANETEYTEKFAALEKRCEALEAQLTSKFEENSNATNQKFEELGKLVAELTGNQTKTLEAVNKFAAMQPEPTEEPVSRQMAKINKEVSAGRRIQEARERINKQKANQ